MAEYHLHVRGLAENAHVRQDAVVHKVMCTNAVTAEFFADEFIAPLCFFNLAHDSGDDDVALQLHACAHECLHRLRSEEHTSELQSRQYLVCRLLLEKKKKKDSRTSVKRKPESTDRPTTVAE